MKIEEIFYTSKFEKNIKSLPKEIREKAYGKEADFRRNPHHPSLKTHKLKGI